MMVKMAYFNNSIQSQRGVALYLALAILSILLGIALGVAAILFGQMRILSDIGYSVTAFYSADSGVERELFEQNYLTKPVGHIYACFVDLNGGGVETCSDTNRCPDNLTDDQDACYQVNIAGSSPTTVNTLGFYKNTRRAIEITF